MAIIYSTIEKMRSIQHLAEHSRVWVYQANRFLSEQEIVAISNALSQFIESWNAHGASLYAGFEIISSRFVVLAVDEEKALASGCSIDKSVHFFQKIGEQLNIDFFNRMQVMYEMDGELKDTPLHQFWAMRKANLIGDDIIVYDNLVKNIAEFKERWRVSFAKSWHAEMWGRS
jgi:hypothetical protein